jgi:hypothetical protein
MTKHQSVLTKRANEILARDWKWQNELRIGAAEKSRALRKAERKARLKQKRKRVIKRERL